MILNGAEEFEGGKIPDKATAREQLGLPGDSFCLGYLGTVYERYDFATMLAAMALCRKEIPHLYFLLAGGGPALEQVKGWAGALAAVILHLYQHPRERERRAADLARDVVARLTWKAVAGDILAVMEKPWKAPIAA
jgi:glycosyltransferase involved in cell wall biosynthesis